MKTFCRPMFGRLLALLVLSTFALAALPVRAQLVPRTVLLEEGTNWSCPPCAQLNPYLEAWLATHGDSIIQIAYHPNWPGANDPMYMNDMSDNQGRVVTYYGISGVPQVEIDGAAQSSATSVFEQAFRQRIQKLSPIAITMDRTVDVPNATVTVNVHLKVVGDVSSYKRLVLRVAAVERYVDTTGPNGEKRYMNPMRAMMPDLNGTPLTITNGQTKDFSFTYDLNDSYRKEKMSEVAFVQDDATKEVLQAGTTAARFSVAALPGQSPIQVLSGATGSCALQIHHNAQQTLIFSAKYIATAGIDWTVTLNGQGTLTMPVQAGAAGDLALAVTPGTSPYTAGYVLVKTGTSSGDTLVETYPVKFISPTTKIAFVDASADSTKSVPTLKTLVAMALRFVPLTDAETDRLQGWNAGTFSTIILETNKWIVTGTNKASVEQYLATGGHLLLHGGEIAYGLADTGSTPADQDPAFLARVLHATYVQDVASATTAHGVSGDVISSSFATTSVKIASTNTDNPVQPDVITATNGGVPFFYYGTGTTDVAAVHWDSAGARLAYFAFGLQNLPTTSRQQIITAVLKWFDGVAAAPVALGTPAFALGVNYPNPFRSSTVIPYMLSRDEAVRIAIVDARGAEVAVVENGFRTAGAHEASFRAEGLTKGTYFAVIHTAEGSAMQPLTVE